MTGTTNKERKLERIFQPFTTKDLMILIDLINHGHYMHTEKGGNYLSDITLIRQEISRRIAQSN